VVDVAYGTGLKRDLKGEKSGLPRLASEINHEIDELNTARLAIGAFL